jgi:Carbonic anhydrase
MFGRHQPQTLCLRRRLFSSCGTNKPLLRSNPCLVLLSLFLLLLSFFFSCFLFSMRVVRAARRPVSLAAVRMCTPGAARAAPALPSCPSVAPFPSLLRNMSSSCCPPPPHEPNDAEGEKKGASAPQLVIECDSPVDEDKGAVRIPLTYHTEVPDDDRNLDALLESNRVWSEAVRARKPDFFSTLEHIQTPKLFWIGCCDSRVPANEIMGLLPGEVFVHRNIANVVSASGIVCLCVCVSLCAFSRVSLPAIL